MGERSQKSLGMGEISRKNPEMGGTGRKIPRIHGIDRVNRAMDGKNGKEESVMKGLRK